MINEFDKKIKKMRRCSRIIDISIDMFIISLFAWSTMLTKVDQTLWRTTGIILIVIGVISGGAWIATSIIHNIEVNNLFKRYKEIHVTKGSDFEELLFFDPNVTFLQGPDIDDKVLIIGVSGTSIEKYEMSKKTAKKIFCDLTED